MNTFTRPNSWVHVPKAARRLPHGPILPLGTVLPIERVRRSLWARILAAASTATKSPRVKADAGGKAGKSSLTLSTAAQPLSPLPGG